MKKLDYDCTLTKFAEQLNIKLYQAMQMMKYVEHKDNIFISHIKSHLKDGEFVICKICGKSAEEIIRTSNEK